MPIEDYFKKISTDVVTHHSMTRPRSLSQTSNLQAPAATDLPQILQFTLKNGTVLGANTEREISIGRRSRPSDPEVTLDLHTHDGFKGGVSRYHAVIVAVKGILYLRDLNSINGTFLNGYKLMPITSYPLHNGDIIVLGEFEMIVRFC